MSGEKTEKPSEKKIEDAREKGNVPQRKNILETMTLLAVMVAITGTWSMFYGHISRLFDASLIMQGAGFKQQLTYAVKPTMAAINYSVVIAVAAGLFTLIINLWLNKFNFAPKALTPKFEKLNPVAGFKQIFSLQTLYNFIRLLLFFLCVSIIIVVMIWGNLPDGLSASTCGIVCMAPFFPPLYVKTVILILLVMIVMSIFDFRIQNALFTKQNKMSKDEVKKEHKGSEGDPEIKAARSRLSRTDAALPQLKEVTHVLYSSSALIGMIWDQSQSDVPPFVVMKTGASGVQSFLFRFRAYGAKCVNLPSAANQLFRVAKIGNYVDERGSMEVARMLKAAGDLTD